MILSNTRIDDPVGVPDTCWWWAPATAIVCLIGLGACRPPAEPVVSESDRQPYPIVLQTDWFPQAEHGGFYQAAAKGFYAEEGLDVEILPGGPGALTKHRVVQGLAHFAINRSDDIVVAVDRGLPLVMVSVVMQGDPQALMMHPSHAVTGFEALDRRTLVASPGLNWINYLERQYSIVLHIQPHTFSLTHFLADETLVQQCFVTNEPYFVRQHGVDPVVLMISDSGFEPFHAVFSSRSFTREHPDKVRAFSRASLRGWIDYMEGDPSPGDALILASNPRMTPGLLAYARRTMIERRLVTGDPARGDLQGRVNRIRLQDEIDLLRELGIVEHQLRAEDLIVSPGGSEDG